MQKDNSSYSAVFRKSLTACILLFIIFQSCSKKEELSPEANINITEHKIDNNMLVDFLIEQGFPKDDIIYDDTLFTIHGDMVISRKELIQYFKIAHEGNNSRIAQRKSEFLVSNSRIGNIRIFIDGTVPSEWRTATSAAINKYNNTILASSVHFVEVSNAASADITITTYTSSLNTIAYAYLPSSSGRPGHSIVINTNYNYLSLTDKTTTIVHEMGHTIGLYHTNLSNGLHIDGTSTSDPQSVMNASLITWTDFSHNDIRAIQILYPASSSPPRLTPIYRYYRDPFSAHFYTNNFVELRFQYFEGIECFVWDHHLSGSVPIYRYYNATHSKHMYTINYDELGAGSWGYVYEGIIGYAYNTPVTGTVPIYRYYNPTTNNHWFSKTSTTPSGYISEGIEWYAFE